MPLGPEQDAVIKGITGEIADKGFLVANLDKRGELGAHRQPVADDVRSGLLRRGDDPRLHAAL